MKKLALKLLVLPLLTVFTLSSCKKNDDMQNSPAMKSKTFMYEFNTGQAGSGTAYKGNHANSLSAQLRLEELSSGKTKVTVTLMNTMDGKNYPVHSHDAADAASTPNGTPYNEVPNADVLVGIVKGNGGTAMYSQESSMSFDDLTTKYAGYFVVHDPTQAMSTKDLTTFLIVGSFAR
ncbi:MAG: hypothetical protein GC180_12980 [Bacteroidetes bacterium]|nr:hypothetical protein [Bacteroidota bacterium]